MMTGKLKYVHTSDLRNTATSDNASDATRK